MVKGCVACSGASGATGNNAITNFVSCTAPIVPAAAGILTTNAGAAYITNLVCEPGYYPSNAGTCTLFDANAVVLSSPITACKDGWFLDANVGSATIGKCVVCDGNALTCKNTAANKGVTVCNPGYTVTLGVCT